MRVASDEDDQGRPQEMIRGYVPKDEEDPVQRHVLLLRLSAEPLAFDLRPRMCVTVHKHYLDGSRPDVLLLNLLSGAYEATTMSSRGEDGVF